MKTYLKTYFRHFDYPIFIAYVILCLLGLVMVYSASIMQAIQEGRAPDYFFKKQLTSLIIAAFIFIVAAFFPYKHYSNKGLLSLLMVALIVLLAWVTFAGFGRLEVGSQSWINIGGMNFQPSEYAKLFIILYFAGSLYKKGLKHQSIEKVQPNDIVYPILVWLIVLFSVGLETDLGAFAIIGVIAVSVLVVSGIRGKILRRFAILLSSLGFLVAVAIAILKWEDLFSGSRLGRFLVLKNPFEYSEGSGYQIVNGYYAIGGGGLEGRGLGQSIQKLGYLPHPDTDFIMAIIAEELGILGVGVVIIGLMFIVLRGCYIAMTSEDPLARMIAGGVAGWIGFQTFLNIGGLSGLVPLTGVTLPFISAGGTSILMLSAAIGILLNVSMYYKYDKLRKKASVEAS